MCAFMGTALQVFAHLSNLRLWDGCLRHIHPDLLSPHKGSALSSALGHLTQTVKQRPRHLRYHVKDIWDLSFISKMSGKCEFRDPALIFLKDANRNLEM